MECKALLLLPELKSSKYLEMITDIIPEIEEFEKENRKNNSIPSLTKIIFANSDKYVKLITNIFIR